MVHVVFYEKPGCINNTKQKVLLQAAGHTVEAHNLLTTEWTADRLRSFFGDRPIPTWFNPTAPQIKSGEVVPAQLNEETALALMVQNPLLIRRPLMQVGDRQEVGFDVVLVSQWIGLQPSDSPTPDLETCPHTLSPS